MSQPLLAQPPHHAHALPLDRGQPNAHAPRWQAAVPDATATHSGSEVAIMRVQPYPSSMPAMTPVLLTNYRQRDQLDMDARRLAATREDWMALCELGHLCSQHHLSSYSALKYGPAGSPFAYIPLSIQQPHLVLQTAARQACYEARTTAWMIEKRRRKLADVSQQVHLASDGRQGVDGAVAGPAEPVNDAAAAQAFHNNMCQRARRAESTVSASPQVCRDHGARLEAEIFSAMSEPMAVSDSSVSLEPSLSAPFQASRSGSPDSIVSGSDSSMAANYFAGSGDDASSRSAEVSTPASSVYGASQGDDRSPSPPLSKRTCLSPPSPPPLARRESERSPGSPGHHRHHHHPRRPSFSHHHPLHPRSHAFDRDQHAHQAQHQAERTDPTAEETVAGDSSDAGRGRSDAAAMDDGPGLNADRTRRGSSSIVPIAPPMLAPASVSLESARGVGQVPVMTAVEPKEAAVGHVSTEATRLQDGGHRIASAATAAATALVHAQSLQAQPAASVERVAAAAAAAPSGVGGTPTAPDSGSAQASSHAAMSVKTSETHPINISVIIPPELVPFISERIYASLPESLLRLPHASRNPKAAGLRLTSSILSHVLASAKLRQGVVAFEPTMAGARGVADLHSGDLVADASLDPDRDEQRDGDNVRLFQLERSIDLADTTGPRATATLDALGIKLPDPEADPQLSPAEAYAAATSIGPAGVAATPSATPDESGPRYIGNLFLSSCPGKKVRLSGPVKGRGAICRDLGLDLGRVKSMGVGAVVCCLDDEELGFLGAPWEEYERVADELGLDVIRLPMAEGFAPTSCEFLDAHITSLVKTYTLAGVHVLVHCRGGVGRAGLIACSWMLKMGLVGPGTGAETPLVGVEQFGGDEVMRTVERLIEVIRRRRSPKAVETAEQAKFIYEYVTYLYNLRREEELRQGGRRSDHRQQQRGQEPRQGAAAGATVEGGDGGAASVEPTAADVVSAPAAPP